MNKKLISLSSLIILLTLPFFAMGQQGPPPNVAFNFPPLNPQGPLTESLSEQIQWIIDSIFSFIWPIFSAFAILMFIIAGFMFLTANGDPSKTSSAKKALIWGIVGVTVGILAFSIPFIINGLLGV